MLYKKMEANSLKNEFINWERDYFTLEACEKIIEIFEELEENKELDIIELCCMFSEDLKKNLHDYGDVVYYDLNNGNYLILV